MKKNRLNILVVLLAAALVGIAAATMKTSQYPNTATLQPTYLFLVADPGVTNYNITWAQMTNLLQTVLALNGSNVVGNVKQPFETNYTALATDDVLMAYGTNQIITLMSCSSARTGKSFTVTSTNANGIVIVTNATGAQQVFNGELAYTNTGAGSITLVNSGAHWWPRTD